MHPATVKATHPGRARLPATIGRDEGEVGIVLEVLAQRVPEPPSNATHVDGPIRVGEATRRQWDSHIVPLVQRLVRSLKLPYPYSTISVCNVGAASINDREIEVSGFSADAAVFLASISAALAIPLREGVVSTGHIASAHGAIRAVKGMPAKLDALRTNRNACRFLYPDPEADDSLKNIAPGESARLDEALRSARDWVELVPVRDIDSLIRGAFDERDLIVSALENKYFLENATASKDADVVPALSSDLPKRFWAYLTSAAQTARRFDDYDLLAMWARFHIQRGIYPKGAGARLYGTLAAVPSGVRNLRFRFPLLVPAETLDLVKLASPRDLEDVRRLLDAIVGDHLQTSALKLESIVEADDDVLAALLPEIDPDTLALEVGMHFDEARASFISVPIVVDTREDVMDVLSAFGQHLYPRTQEFVGPCDHEAMVAEMAAHLERAFARWGGINGAFAEAHQPTRGGMRFVLDVLVDELKAEAIRKRVAWSFTRALEPLDYEQRVQVMRALMKQLGPALPPDLRHAPPEQFVSHAQPLIQAYAQMLSNLRKRFREC